LLLSFETYVFTGTMHEQDISKSQEEEVYCPLFAITF